ncbi:MAG: hypothetical protein RLZZ200_1777 [Pseudomonadota bacterium]|jgi:hypothetical protein
MPRPRFLLALATVFMLMAPRGQAAEPGVEDPSPGKWPQSVYRWHYFGGVRPAWLTADEAKVIFLEAAHRWEKCGVKLEYLGDTTVPPGTQDGINVAGWSLQIPAKLRGLTVGRSREGRLVERDVSIRADRLEFERSRHLLEKVVTHELGHAIGLTHSSRCDDVMTLAASCPKADPETLPLEPTRNDLRRCLELYGPAEPHQ